MPSVTTLEWKTPDGTIDLACYGSHNESVSRCTQVILKEIYELRLKNNKKITIS